MTHTDIIASIFSSCNYKTYLELGVATGVNLASVAVHAEYALGVDLNDIRVDKNTNLIIDTTTDFFIKNNKKFDMIFIDADHSFYAVYHDFFESLKILNEGGTILMHDMDPEEHRLFDQAFCGDCYKMHDVLNNNNCSWVTLPANNCGLTIVRRKTDLRYQKFL